jgi:hypothetical protein
MIQGKFYSLVLNFRLQNLITLKEKKTSLSKFDRIWVKSIGGIYPEWLLGRDDFKDSLELRMTLKKSEIPKICLKPNSMRTPDERNKTL